MGLEAREDGRQAGKVGGDDAAMGLVGSRKDLGSCEEQWDVFKGSETGMRTLMAPGAYTTATLEARLALRLPSKARFNTYVSFHLWFQVHNDYFSTGFF